MQEERVPSRARRAERPRWQPPPVTTALALSLCAAYVLQSQVHSAPVSFESLRLGAATGWLVQSGEWFRLATANFVHMSLGHFVVNTLFIAGVGGYAESSFGPTRMGLLALSGALGGTLAASALSDSIVLGSSTLGFGLGFGVLVLRLSGRPGPWLALLLGVGFALLFHVIAPWRNQISFLGHFGASVAGALTAALIHPIYGGVTERVQARIAKAGALVLAALLVWGGIALSRWDERTMFAHARTVYARPSPHPGLVADLALHAYRSPLATPRQRQDARSALRRVLRGRSRAAYPFAVEGYLLEREGDFPGALRAFHEAFARDPQMQSAHAVARLQERGGSPLRSTPAVTLEARAGGQHELVVTPGLGRGCRWHLLAREGRTTVAVVHLALGEANTETIALRVPSRETGRKTTWHVALERCGAVAPQAREVYYWSIRAFPGKAGRRDLAPIRRGLFGGRPPPRPRGERPAPRAAVAWTEARRTCGSASGRGGAGSARLSRRSAAACGRGGRRWPPRSRRSAPRW